MEANYSSLLFVQGRDPATLRENLLALPFPSKILDGSWFYSSVKCGVWVTLDRPVEVKKRRLTKDATEVHNTTKEI